MGQYICQNCETPAGSTYDNTPKFVTYRDIYRICHDKLINKESNEKEFKTRKNVIIGRVMICKITDEVCCSNNCPVKDFMNDNIEQINKGE
jgi:hypothetical protein